MQRVTIVPADGYVAIDGRGFNGLDLSALDSGIHAVHWYGTTGELEMGGLNIAIDDLNFVQAALDTWQAAADAEDNPPPLLPADHAAAKYAELETACRNHITGGVASNALGSDHRYPTGETDQLNLNGCMTESLLNDADPNWTTPFWCADSNGNWDRRTHDHTQIRAAGTAIAGHVRSAQNKLKSLNDQLQAIVADTGLTDDEKRTAINAVNW